MEICKIEVRAGDRSLIAEGTSEFVSKTLDLWDGFIRGEKTFSTAPAPSLILQAEATPELGADKSVGHIQYDNVFDSADDKLKIIAHVPGKNKAELTRNTALILLYGKLLDGADTVPSELVREACSDQGCYDPTNFAQYVKGLKSRVVMNTKQGGGYDIKLTAPGRKEAKELVELLQRAE